MHDSTIGAPHRFVSSLRRFRGRSLFLAGFVALGCVNALPVYGASSTVTTLALTAGGAFTVSVKSGTVVTLTAAVTSGTTPVSSGRVNFCDAAATLCTDIHLLGTAQLTPAGAAAIKLRPGPGVHGIKAVFAGINSFAPSQSAVSSLNVTGISTTTIAQSGSPGNYTLTATVVGRGSTTPPTGTIDFVDLSGGPTVLGSPALETGKASQSFLPQNVYETGVGPASVAAGDFNGDGKPDLAIVNDEDNTLTVLLGDGNGGMSSQNTFPAGGIPVSITIGDFNGDGNQDVAIANQGSNTVGVLLGKGNGAFLGELLYATGNNPQSVAIGDFNGDGNQDLVVANNADNSVSVLLGRGDGTFQGQVAYAAGSGAVFVAAADWNGDGKQDLAVANIQGNSVSVLLGKGDGTFNQQVAYPAGGGACSIAVADFDGDGKLDIAIADDYDLTIMVLKGSGDGAFTPKAIYPTGTYPQSLTVSDFNGDGLPDLAVTNGYNAQVGVLLGKGDGTFGAQASYVVRTNALSVAATDLNGDGATDLVVTDWNDASVSLLLNSLSTTAKASITGVSLHPLGTIHKVDAEYSGDSLYVSSVSGTTSLSAASVATALTLSANPPSTVTYGNSIALTAALSPYSTQGFSTDSEKVTFYNGTKELGTAALSSGTAILNLGAMPTGVNSLTAAFGGDGTFLSSSSNTVSYLVHRTSVAVTQKVTARGGEVSSVPARTVVALTATVTAGSSPVKTGQVNFCDASAAPCTGPNLLGTAQLTPSGNAILTLRPGVGAHNIRAEFTGTAFSLPATSAVSTLDVTNAAATTTINQTGSPGNYSLTATVTGSGSRIAPTGTISFVDTTNGRAVLRTAVLNPGTVARTFSAEINYAAGSSPNSVAVGDFNRDGKPDLAVADSNGGTVSILLGNGNGTFAASTAYPTGAAPCCVALGDFNRDGIPDLAVANSQDSSVSVLIGNGDGTFKPQVNWGQSGSPTSIAVADFDGDGRQDVAVAYQDANKVTVMIGDGDGAFSGREHTTPSSTGNGPISMAVGDFNGDGRPDIVVANNSDNTVGVLLGKGDGGFQPQVTYPVGTRPSFVVTGDYNGDGKTDLAIANQFDNTVSILLGQGSGTFGPPVTHLAGVAPIALEVGDFNGDGRLDLAVAAFVKGNVSVLLGNGDGTLGPNVLYSAGGEPVSLATGDFDGDGRPDLAVAIEDKDQVGVLLDQLTVTATARVTGVSVHPAGSTHNLEARYLGDSLYAPSSSGTVPIFGATASRNGASVP